MSEQAFPVAAEFGEEYCGEDRRVVQRFPAPRKVTCRVATIEGTASWPAQLRDVSFLGVGLLVPEQVTVGTQLFIDLTEAGGRSVMARVVHVTPNAGGGWVVGCALTSELSDEELQAFQAARVRPTAPDGRRWVRFPCSVETVCYALDNASVTQAPARILDISPGGLGLLTICEFELGMILNVELPDGTGLPHRRVVRVVHVKDRGDGDWFLGCEFADTLDEEMLRLVVSRND